MLYKAHSAHIHTMTWLQIQFPKPIIMLTLIACFVCALLYCMYYVMCVSVYMASLNTPPAVYVIKLKFVCDSSLYAIWFLFAFFSSVHFFCESQIHIRYSYEIHLCLEKVIHNTHTHIITYCQKRNCEKFKTHQINVQYCVMCTYFCVSYSVGPFVYKEWIEKATKFSFCCWRWTNTNKLITASGM